VKGPRGRPFEAGNQYGRGRPKGSRNRRNRKVEEILEQYGEALIKKCIGEALQGNVRALRLCMERIVPALREPGVKLALPKGRTMEELEVAGDRLMRAIGAGNISPAEGEKIAAVIESRRRVLESKHLEERIDALERQGRRGN